MTKPQFTFAQLFPLIKADLEAKDDAGRDKPITPALLGEPGIGKSSLIEDLARVFKTEVFTIPINQIEDRADLTGVRLTQTKSGSWQQQAFPHATIMSAIEYAEQNPDENPILFLDEFNRATSDITSSVLSFVTLRRCGTVDFPPNLRLIVAGNDKGNVTSLDTASISRFSVYRVKPDLETFLKVQTLNPYVREVLMKHPEDLMAPDIDMGTATSDDDDEDDSSEADMFDISQLEAFGEDTFKQITRPRTIEYTSRWLNQLGIDKSGKDEEKQVLSELLSDMSDEGSNVLLMGIQSHAGETTFSAHLYEEISMHFNTMIGTAQVSSQPLLTHIRPEQSVINQLSRAGSVQDVTDLIESMNDKDIANAIVWLTENESVKEVNNNQSVNGFMANAPHKIDALTNDNIQNLMKVLTDDSRVAKESIKAMLNSSAQSIDTYKGMLLSVMDS